MPFKNRKKPFFLVWTPATGYARKRHQTADLAAAEAERLSKLNPKFKYHVLMAIGYCKEQESE